MKRLFRRLTSATLAIALASGMLLAGSAAAADQTVSAEGGTEEIGLRLIARYASGSEFNDGGAEIVAYDPGTQRAYSINGSKRALEILDLSGLRSGPGEVRDIALWKSISLAELSPNLKAISDITSVAVSPTGDYIAVAVPAEPKTDPGHVVFLDREGTYLSDVTVGANPDMVGFTPDGKTLLSANEGEPNDAYTIDPEGTVSIIDVSSGVSGLGADRVETAAFTSDVEIDDNVRVVKPGATQAQDFEPEYIAFSPDSRTAYVSLQEANAIAKLDLAMGKFTRVYGLGYKDESLPAQAIDASDKDDAVNIRPWPVLGMYMPDGIASYTVGGRTYLLTPNEGDSKDWEGFSEEVRVEDLKDQYALNADLFEGLTQAQIDEMVTSGLFDEDQLGRLHTTVSAPKNSEGKYEAVYAYGGRSFSIWSADDLSLVYDSGSDFERIVAREMPDFFNTDNDENGFDARSDDKGPEPEAVVTGEVNGSHYAFVGLERTSGVMVYDIDDPAAPAFVTYANTRDFGTDVPGGDLAPEGLKFVPAEESPTGTPLLLAAHEVSGTVAVFEIVGRNAAPTPTPSGTKTITILHTNDSHARVEEAEFDGMGFAKLSAIVKEKRANNPNTLLLDAGDTFHGTNFATLVRGESIPKVMNEAGYDAMAAGNHDFDYGYERLLELKDMADFPVLSANVKRADGSLLLEPYAIKEVDGVKLGLFGLTTPETTYKTHPNNVEGLVFEDPAEVAKEMVAYLKSQQVDAIIAVTHLGIDKSSTDTSVKVAKEAAGIDLIVDGHSHSTLVEGLQGDHDTLIVSAGEYTKNLGEVTLTFDSSNKLIGKKARLIAKEEAANVTPDPAITQIIEDVKKDQGAVLAEAIGRTAVELDGEREHVRASETNLGNLLADAMLDMSKADAAMTNGGGIRASIGKGEITKGDVITVLPFGNLVVAKRVKGSAVKAALENGVGAYPDPKGAFPQVAGMTFKIDPAQPAGSRVHGIMIQGKPLDPDKEYVLATNDFMAAGGDEYTMLKDAPVVKELSALDEALIRYIQKLGAASPKVEGRIVVERAAKPGQSGAAGKLYVVKPGDNLYRIGLLHGTTWRKLAEINRLKDPALIYPNQQLLLPE